MSVTVTAADHRRRRRLGVAAGAALLTLAVPGCSGLGRTAVGPIIYTTEQRAEMMVHSPLVKGCHTLAPAGAREVTNGTLVDIILYRSRDCSGGGTTYLATTFTDVSAGSLPAWHSYRIVH